MIIAITTGKPTPPFLMIEPETRANHKENKTRHRISNNPLLIHDNLIVILYNISQNLGILVLFLFCRKEILV